MSALLEMAEACKAAGAGKPADAKQLAAAARTLELIADVPDAMRALLVAARSHPELKNADYVASVSQHVNVLVEVMDAAMPIMAVLDAFPGATVDRIESRNHRILTEYANGFWDGGQKARLAIGRGYPAELQQFEMRMDAEGDVTVPDDVEDAA